MPMPQKPPARKFKTVAVSIQPDLFAKMEEVRPKDETRSAFVAKAIAAYLKMLGK